MVKQPGLGPRVPACLLGVLLLIGLTPAYPAPEAAHSIQTQSLELAQAQTGLTPPPKRPDTGLKPPPKRPGTGLTAPPKRPATNLAAPPKRPAVRSAPTPDTRGQLAQTPIKRSDSPIAVHRVAAKVRAENQGLKARLAQRERAFKTRLSEARKRVEGAKRRLAKMEAEGRQLEQRFDGNKLALEDKARLLENKIGALKELFGVFQQNASDLIGAFNGSPTSAQYPDRDVWLEGFANRMRNASEVSSTEDIKMLWYEMMREIEARGDVVQLNVPVFEPATGSADPTQPRRSTDQDVVRVGGFNLLSAEAGGQYLQWDVGAQRIEKMPRQPAGPYAGRIRSYLSDASDAAPLSIDPTGGTLTRLLAEKPTRKEQADQGGLVGYLIIALGIIAFVLAALKLLDISQISLRVSAQKRRLDRPSSGNALGRVLQVYQDNRHRDSEILGLRLREQVDLECERIHRFTIFLMIIASVAPLLGLLGTVVGMINTFQAITLYGTGDPQTMAGGISQALITTVLGLIVAVPSVLLNAIVSSRAKSVAGELVQHRANLLGDRLEAEYRETQQPMSGAAMPSPA